MRDDLSGMITLESKFRYPIAIDMSDDHVYAAQLKKTNNGPVIRGLAYLEGPWDIRETADGGEECVGLLKGILKDRRFSGKKVLLHLPYKYISSFPVRFRIEDSELIEEAILRESREYISFPLEEAVIDYPSLVPFSQDDHFQYKAIIIAINRNQIHQYLRIFRRAGMIVEAVDFDVSSLIRLHQYMHEIRKNPVLLCNIDSRQSVICVTDHDGVLVERHISWGFEHLVEKLRANFELGDNENKTEILLTKYGLAHYGTKDDAGSNTVRDEATDGMRRAIYQIIMPYIEELIDEFHKMTVYLRSEESEAIVDRIYMYGRANMIHGLDHYFEKRINIQTYIVNPLTGFVPGEESILLDRSGGAPFGLALGLALRRVKWL